ncbi:MAG TPA: hypothetical protein VHW05_07895 [Phenylobacterium sp.]|jgi:hypothetical protein|nr:hypothetical protein [Phenylobacterium sp.]
MRTWLIALAAAACATTACSPKSSLYLQPGEKSPAASPPKPAPPPKALPAPPATPAPAKP